MKYVFFLYESGELYGILENGYNTASATGCFTLSSDKLNWLYLIGSIFWYLLFVDV